MDEAPSITSGDSATFSEGNAGSSTITTSGFPTAALSESGALPGGVTFTDNGDGTATLAGTPAANSRGSYPITINATNGVSPDASQTFTLTVNAAPAITSDSTTTFTEGAAGTFTVVSNGSPTAALSETGTLPSGVTFTDNGDGTANLGRHAGDGFARDLPDHHHGEQRGEPGRDAGLCPRRRRTASDHQRRRPRPSPWVRLARSP